MDKGLVLVGGGGHCRSCIEVLEGAGINIHGILDENLAGTDLLGYPVLGGDAAMAPLAAAGHPFLVTVGQLKNAALRQKLFETILRLDGRLHTVVAATARLSRHAAVGDGTILMQQVIVNAGAVVGRNCILNNKALVEHDCDIGDHTHISTAAVLNGGCRVGSRVFIGSGSILAQNVTIADDVVVGAGSVVIRSIDAPGTYAGNPARKIK